MEYLGNGQAGIDFAESRIKAASALLRVEAEEYGKLGLPGREFREIMEGKIDEMAYSLEFSILQTDALKAEFLWATFRQTADEPGSVERSKQSFTAADRVQAFMDKKSLKIPEFAEMIGTSQRTVAYVLAGVLVGKGTRAAVAKALGTTPEELFPK
jgi:hypothetical protein